MKPQTLRLTAIAGAAVAATAIVAAIVTNALTGDSSIRSPQDLAAQDVLSSGTPSIGGAEWSWSDADQVLTLVPGIITVHCDGDLATLVSWSPNPGFRADDPVRGPAAQVSVRFESDTDSDYLVTATCATGVATASVGPDADDHGGDDHGGGDNGGGGDDNSGRDHPEDD